MNPYAVPESALEEQLPSGRATAVFIGAAVGNGISYAVLFLSGLVFLWALATQGVPTQELYSRAYQSTPYLLFAHTLGFLCLLPGGYWSARLSKDKPLLTASLAGCLLAAFTLSTNLIPYELPISLWSRIASVVESVPAFWLGALWWRRAA
jgi:hypothetical protein